MTVKELKDMLNNFNDDENIIGEIAMSNCGGFGMYNETSSALLLSITSEERERIKMLQESIEEDLETLKEKNAEEKYNIPFIKKCIEEDKKEIKFLLDKLNIK